MGTVMSRMYVNYILYVKPRNIYCDYEFQIHQVDTRTDQEKTDDLIQEYLAQLELSSTNDPCKEVQEKLNSLRGEDNKTVSRQKCKFKIQIYNY